MTEHLQIVIADDNYLVREGTRQLLEASGEVTVQAAVGSAPELLDAVRRRRPDAVLTDIRMPVPAAANGDQAPAMEGIDAAHAIKMSQPRVGVVILSQYADESYAFELFRNGTEPGVPAQGRRRRPGPATERAAAVRPADRSSTLRSSMPWSAARPAAVLPVARLSPRELDVLREMAQGRGNAGIAQALHLSESSVEKHVNAIFTKLDLASEQQVHRRVAAVLTFLRDAGLQPRQSPGG